ncbi:hypothetical protein BGW39_006390 [Mortierella sp. 14UC]|nr:hypothetical protein BGW39_006390 [Mortierella sp. 14UC]
MALYLDGAGKIDRIVGLSAVNHGTTAFGLEPMIEFIKSFKWLVFDFDFLTSIAPGLQDILSTSAFIKKVNEGSDTLDSVFHANIVTKYDAIVPPYNSSFQGTGGLNVLNFVL